jgi:hypothetical protein
MWWSACRDYIDKERDNMDHDPFFFKEFEYLVERICEVDVKKREKTRAQLEPSRSAVEYFLQTEAGRLQAISEAA